MLRDEIGKYLEDHEFKLGTCWKHADAILALVRERLLSDEAVEAAATAIGHDVREDYDVRMAICNSALTAAIEKASET